MADRELTRLADRLDDLERSVYSRTGQAAHTTIIDGAINQVETYDTGAVDNLGAPIYGQRIVSRTGRQPDGGNTMVVLDGPTPPAPAGFTVTAGMGTLTIKWDGSFVGGAPTPSDFYATVVHLARTADLGSVILPSPVTAGAAVVAKDGDGVTIGGLDPQEYTVALVCVSQAGKWSVPSATQTATPDDGSNLPAVADIRVTADQALALAGSKGKVYSQATAPTVASTPPPVAGDLWFNTSTFILSQYTGASWAAVTLDASQNVRANTVTANLLASQLVLSTKIVAGPLNDAHAELDQYGLSLYQKRPDGTIVKTSSLGTPGTTDFIQVYDPNSGKSVASLNQDGRVVAASASLGTSPGSVVINGKTVESMFWPMPRGAVSINYRGTNLAGVGATEQNWLEAQVFLERGRLFKVGLNPTYMLGSANGGIGWFVLRWAKNGAAVTSTSEQVQSAKMYLPLASEVFTSPPMTMIFSTAAQDTQFAEYRFLVTVRGSGAGTVTAVAGYSTPSILTIEDLGLDRADTGITSWATGSSRKQYVAYWQSGTVQNYNAATGAKVSAPVGHPTWQGFGTGTGNTYSSLALFDGVSLAAWDDATPAMVGKTVAQALAGVPSSDIMSVEFNFLMAYSSTGYSVTVPFSAGNTLAMPATLTAPVAESSNITTPPGSWSAAVRMGNQRYDSVHFGDRNSANAGTWGYIEKVQMRVAFIK